MQKIRLKKQDKLLDRKLLVTAVALTIFGLVAVADASAPVALNVFSDKFYYFRQQAVWGLVGLLTLAISSKVHYSFWEKIATPLFFISLVLLVLVLIPGIGVKAFGARRWIILGPISFQPAEFVKLSLALYLAKVASRDKNSLSYFLPIGLVAGLIMLQPDLGTTLVLSFMGMVQVFVAGVNLLHFIGAFLIAIVSALLLILTSEYRRNRLLTFMEATQDPLGRAYHIRQVLLALGSGGLFGVGLGQSRQKFLFLPEAATDSIFAVIAEELGFIGAFILIAVFAFFVFRGLTIASQAPDRFSKILAIGIVAWFGGQIFLNIGSMVALVPLTGLPLPFISYGGSALTMALFATGILLNISRYAEKAKK